MPWRVDRVGELLRQEIGRIVSEELRDPRLQMMVTVLGVEVSSDLHYATVAMSIMGVPEEQHSAVEALEAAAGFLRHELAERLRLRHVPTLRFKLDTSLEEGDRVLALIEEGLRAKEANGQG
jgi:ribosome-binding factor A